MRRRVLTDAQIARIEAVGAQRLAIPTNAQLAREMGCCERVISKCIERARRIHVEQKQSATSTHKQTMLDPPAAKP